MSIFSVCFSGEFYFYHSTSPIKPPFGRICFYFFCQASSPRKCPYEILKPQPLQSHANACILTLYSIHLPSKSSEKKSLAKYTRQPMDDMDVSENSGTPKSSILIGFSIINHPFWGAPIFGNIHMGNFVLAAKSFSRRFGLMDSRSTAIDRKHLWHHRVCRGCPPSREIGRNAPGPNGRVKLYDSLGVSSNSLGYWGVRILWDYNNNKN